MPVVGDGGSIRHIVADVTVEDQIAAAVAFAAEPGGGLDILVANAGGSLHMGAMEEFDVEAVRATIDLNMVGTMLSVKHAIPLRCEDATMPARWSRSVPVPAGSRTVGCGPTEPPRRA